MRAKHQSSSAPAKAPEGYSFSHSIQPKSSGVFIYSAVPNQRHLAVFNLHTFSVALAHLFKK